MINSSQGIYILLYFKYTISRFTFNRCLLLLNSVDLNNFKYVLYILHNNIQDVSATVVQLDSCIPREIISRKFRINFNACF